MRFTVLMWTAGIFLVFGFLIAIFHYDLLVRPPWLQMGIFCAVLALAIAIPLGRAWNTDGKPVRAFLNALLLAIWFSMKVSLIILMGYIPALNACFDDSPRERHRAKVLRFGSGKMERYIHVESWRGNESEFIHVSKDLARARPERVVVTTRAGFLGFEWVVSVVAARKTPETK